MAAVKDPWDALPDTWTFSAYDVHGVKRVLVVAPEGEQMGNISSLYLPSFVGYERALRQARRRRKAAQ